MLRSLFGQGKFDDCFGELSFIIVLDPKFSQLSKQEFTKKIQEHQYMTIKELVLFFHLSPLTERRLHHWRRNWTSTSPLVVWYIFSSYLSWLILQTFELFLQTDVTEKIPVPGGIPLLSLIGYVYKQEAKQHMGRYFGLESLWHNIAEKTHFIREAFKATVAALELQADIEEIQKKGAEGFTVDR